MQRAPDQRPHALRLRELATRFRAEERWMTGALQDLQRRLDHWHREASYQQTETPLGDDPLLHRCDDLQHEYDELATQLVHVRMAISGADEELCGLGGSRARAS